MTRPWDRLDPRDYVRLQEALFVDLVRRYLYPFSPFYRQWFDEHGVNPRRIRRLRDLESIPPVSRTDFDRVPEDDWRPFRALLRPEERTLKRTAHRRLLRRVAVEKLLRGDDAAERLLAEEFKPVHLHPPADGGPVIGYTIRDLSALAQAAARSMAVLGAQRSDVLFSTMPYGPDLRFWHVYYGAMGAGMAAFHLGAGGTVRPSRAAGLMDRGAMSVLLTQAGYAEGLLRGAPPSTFARLRILGLWSTGEMHGARERYTLRLRTGGAGNAVATTVLGVPEARAAWAECPPPLAEPGLSHGYHTYPDLEILEVVDAQGRSLPEDEPGELVYSSLDWRGSALLRYRTGLVARRGITWAPCPGCGRTVPRIPADLSRLEWRVRVAGPRGPIDVDVADVLPYLWRATGVALWQVEVVRGGGERGTDAVVAYMTGIPREEIEGLRRSLSPFGVRCRAVSMADFRPRFGVGSERPEVRVVVRDRREGEEPAAPGRSERAGPAG